MNRFQERRLDVLVSPADIEARRRSGFAGETCVVFDVLRATSVMVAGLSCGALGYLPVEEIADAVKEHRERPHSLLAGERGGLRITAAQSGGVEFDLGNSPREHSRVRVEDRLIVCTTTNGTRALRACIGAESVLVGAFLNLRVLAVHLQSRAAQRVTLICAGTGEALADEDVLAAGALCAALRGLAPTGWTLSESADSALQRFSTAAQDLDGVVAASTNGRRLLAIPELRDDVGFCLRVDSIPVLGALSPDGVIRRIA